MLHQSRGLWLWWVLVAVVMMRIGVMRTGAQKIEVDGLNEDQYNRKDSPDDDHKEDKSGLKYMVTEEVYLDIFMANRSKIEKPITGRITIACFGDITPITCLNFIALAKGHRKGRELLTYKGTSIHRIVRDFVIQMGDVEEKNGKGGKSIYGEKFEDENFQLSHRAIGWVSMANHGRNTNGSQFFITLQPARWLDGKHVVFGKVIKGMDIVRKLGELETLVSGRPKKNVKIVDSGVVGIISKYELSSKDIMSSDDIAK